MFFYLDKNYNYNKNYYNYNKNHKENK